MLQTADPLTGKSLTRLQLIYQYYHHKSIKICLGTCPAAALNKHGLGGHPYQCLLMKKLLILPKSALLH